jgi:hypothetical protein
MFLHPSTLSTTVFAHMASHPLDLALAFIKMPHNFELILSSKGVGLKSVVNFSTSSKLCHLGLPILVLFFLSNFFLLHD